MFLMVPKVMSYSKSVLLRFRTLKNYPRVTLDYYRFPGQTILVFITDLHNYTLNYTDKVLNIERI